MKKDKLLGIKNVNIKMPQISPGSWFGLAKNRDRDWNTLLWIIFIVAVLVSILSFYMFYSIEAGTFFRKIDTNEREGSGLDVVLIHNVANSIKDKIFNLEILLNTEPSTYDPSI